MILCIVPFSLNNRMKIFAELRPESSSIELKLFEIGQFDDGGFSSGIFVVDSIAYVADSSQGLEILNVSDPTNPSELKDITDGGIALGVFVLDDLAYVKKYVKEVNKSKDLLRNELNRLRIKTYPSSANFIVADFGEKCDYVYDKLKSKGYIMGITTASKIPLSTAFSSKSIIVFLIPDLAGKTPPLSLFILKPPEALDRAV